MEMHTDADLGMPDGAVAALARAAWPEFPPAPRKRLQTKDISDLQVCEAYRVSREQRDTTGDYDFPYDHLMEMTGAHWKVCYCAMERAYGRGLIECGVSLRTGWLTDKGEALLAQIAKDAAVTAVLFSAGWKRSDSCVL